MSHYIDSFPGREVCINGKSYRYFGGTSYLGLQSNTYFQDLYIQNIKKYGTNYGASRKSNVRISIFEEAETSLAMMVGSEACITLSSGYLAGQIVAKHFDTQDFSCFYAPNSHSALYQKGVIPFEKFEDLVESVKKVKRDKTPVIFLDSIDTMDASYPIFRGLQDLPLYEMIVVVDDSHGIGIMGDYGGGGYKKIKKMKPKELVVCCSLGKGLGIQAGAVFGEKTRIDSLKEMNLFGGASPAAPAALATMVNSKSIYQKQRKLLKENVTLFLKTTLEIHNFNFIKDHPVFTFKNPELAAYLEENRILTTNFKYPNEEGLLMSRIVISAIHTKADIEFLVNTLNTFKN